MRRSVLIGAISAAVLAVPVVSAGAHSEVTSTSPRSGATVSAKVSKVTVTFSETIRSGSISVTGPDGATASQGRGGRDPRNVMRLTVGLRDGHTAGRHTARWKATAADGHKQSGSFRFRIRG